MEKVMNGVVVLIMAVLAAVVGGLGYLVWRLVERTIETIDREIGAAFYLAGAGGLLFAFLLVVIGGALALVRWLAQRTRQIHARDGLYPVIDQGRGQFASLNEAGAQSLAVLAAGRRPTAALAGRVIDAQYRTAPEPAGPPLPEPQPEPQPEPGHYPQKVSVYAAALARELALPVGVDGAGRPVALPLRNLGNVLVAGLPGSGKSELLASMLAGLLRQDASGGRVQVAMVDTKLVSFGNLPPLAALYAPPALEIEDAHALVWRLVEEVRRRFQLLQAAGVRSIEEYQARSGEALPYVVTVIDELADMTADHDRRRASAFSAAAMEIGRKGRAAGVALVMATQRPSADVIPSSLRNLAGAAVAFRLARADDSRLVLDAQGAEQLPSSTPGRCLVRYRDTVQAQAFYAGLEGGQFDRFLLNLPQAIAPAWRVRQNGPGSVIAGDTGQEGANVDAIAAWSSTDQSDYTPEQEAQIRALYDELGSLRAVQRELYGQTGGYWFYRIRDVIDGR